MKRLLSLALLLAAFAAPALAQCPGISTITGTLNQPPGGTGAGNVTLTVLEARHVSCLFVIRPSVIRSDANGAISFQATQGAALRIHGPVYPFNAPTGLWVQVPNISSASLESLVNISSAMTALGDTVYGGPAGLIQRLPIGAEGQVLTVISGRPGWGVGGGGGGGGGAITTREQDGTPSITPTTTLEFAQATGLTLANQGGGVARLSIAGVPINAVAGLQGALDAKENIITFNAPFTRVGSAVSLGQLAISQTTGLQAALDATVPQSRQIITGVGLIGGGDLTANRTLSVVDDSTTQRVRVYSGGVMAGTRPGINLIPGSNVTITAADNAAANRIDVNIAASVAGGGGGLPDPGVSGLVARTALNTTAARQIEGTPNRIIVSNGDGVSNNPTLDIGTDVVTVAGVQSLLNKTLVTPTIASFANAQHAHQSTAGGGVLDAAAIATGAIPANRGGTGLQAYNVGDILYAAGTSTLLRLPIGGDGQVLKAASGFPVWGNETGGSGGFDTLNLDNLADGVSTDLFTVTLPAGTKTGGFIQAEIVATDGTTQQSRTALVRFDAVSEAGGIISDAIVVNQGTPAGMSGSLTGVWATVNESGQFKIRLTPDTSLSSTSNFQVRYQVNHLSSQPMIGAVPCCGSGSATLTSGFADPAGVGIAVKTSAGAAVTRALVAGAGISITNGDGVAGNPVISSTSPVLTPGGSGTELQFRAGPTTFGAVTDSSVSGGAITLGSPLTLPGAPSANLHAATKLYVDTAVTGIVTLTGTQTLTNKTLTAPTIADFTNSLHSHENAAGGGTLSTAALATGTLPIARGGTSFSTYAAGDILYASATNTLAKLPAGTEGHVLKLAGGVPTWAAGGGLGSVTSVALTTPAFLSVSGSPVTSSGTLAVSLATQTANTVFAGPDTGSAAAPTFRALVAADIPSLDAAKITSGTIATARLGSGTANATTFLRGDQTWVAPTGSGTVNSGTLGQLAYYAANGVTVSGNANITYADSRFTINSGLAIKRTAVAATYEMLNSDFLVACTSTGSPVTISLPPTPVVGQEHVVKDESQNLGTTLANPITISGNGLTIEGSSTLLLDVGGYAIHVYYNGSVWKMK